MVITDIQLAHLRLPLSKPFTTSLRTVTRLDDLLVTVLTDSGLVGYGTASPATHITGETIFSIRDSIENHLKSRIIGQPLDKLADLMVRLQDLPDDTPCSQAGVDTALYDLYGKSRSLPVYKLLGGSRSRLTTDITISLADPVAMARSAVEAVERGFSALKVKVGEDPVRDLQRLKLIRKAVGSGVQLRIDANQGWTPDESVYLLKQLNHSDIHIALLEQPVKAGDFEGLKFVKDHASVPIVADESASSPGDVSTIIRMHAADMINVKLMKTGGIHNALRLFSIAGKAGIGCMVGCMMESRVAVTAAAHLAAARNCRICDLDAPLLSPDTLPGGALFEDSSITLSDDPGFGFRDIPASICHTFQDS